MSVTLRRSLPLAITFICGMIVIVEHFYSDQGLASLAKSTTTTTSVIVACSLGLGTITVALTYLKRAVKGEDVLINSVFLVSLIVPIFIGIVFGSRTPAYQWIQDYLRTSVDGAIYGIILLITARIFWRVLRIRSIETLALTFPFFVLLLANAPIGSFLTGQYSELAKSWLYETVYTPAYRALLIGAGVGGISLAVRVLLGMERGYLRGES